MLTHTSIPAPDDTVTTDDIIYNDEPVTVALDDLYDRVGVIVGPPDDPPPDDPPGSAAIREDFDNGVDGDDVTTDTTAFDSITGLGAGTLELTSNFAATGDTGLHIDGSVINYGTYVRPVKLSYKAKFYGKHERTPSATGWFADVLAADGITVAARIGITAAGMVTFQDSLTGTTATATTALVPGDIWKGELTLLASTSGRLAVYRNTAVDNESEVGALAVLTIPQTQAAYTNTDLGLLNTLPSGGAVVGNLANELFEGLTNAVAPTGGTGGTLSATQVLGSGSLTGSTTWAVEGTKSLRFHGNTYHIGNWQWASHTAHAASFYWKHTTTPDGKTWIYQAKNGTNTAVAFQIGIDTLGKWRGRPSTNGTEVVSAGGMSSGDEVRVDIIADPSDPTNKAIIRIYKGATENSPLAGDATWTLNLTGVTVSNYGYEQTGIVSSAATSTLLDGRMDRFRSNNTAVLPSPIGVAAGTGLGMVLDHWWTDPDTMPASLHITVPGGEDGDPTVSDLLVPSNGCWWGTSCPANTGSGSTLAGKNLWKGFAGRDPDIVAFYMNNADWDGVITSTQKAILNPAGGPRCIGKFNWKLSKSGLTMAEIAAGGFDAQIIKWCQGIKQYPWKIFFAPQHEFDNDATADGTPNSRANYKAMFRHVYNLVINVQKVTNVVFIWNVTGFSSQAGVNGANWEAMYPGDDLDFWIAPDPYFSTTSRPTLAELLNIVSPPVSGYDGFYNWVADNHPTKYIMLGEWSVHVDDITDSFGAGQISSIGDLIRDYPLVKAMIQWNGAAANVSRLQNHPLIDAAFAAVGALDYFNVGTQNAA